MSHLWLHLQEFIGKLIILYIGACFYFGTIIRRKSFRNDR